MSEREVKLITVGAADEGVRLDRWLKRRWPQLGQGQIHKLARTGQLRVGGARAKAETRLSAGDVVRVPPLAPASPPPRATDPLSDEEIAFALSLVLHEDNQVLVLNKPAGLAVQGGTKTHRHVDRLLSAFGEGPDRPRLVHRLDRDTSGVLALGRSVQAAAALAEAFAGRETEKTYWALVDGVPDPAEGMIDLPLIKRGAEDRERMEIAERGDPAAQTAISRYRTLAAGPDEAAWMELSPLTGRTHQLRAHMLALGHPILGDPKYRTEGSAARSGGLKLQLHARRLVLPHPAGGVLDVTAPIGPEMRAGFARFGFSEP